MLGGRQAHRHPQHMPRVVTEKVKKSCSALIGRRLRKTDGAFGRQRRMQDRGTSAGAARSRGGVRLAGETMGDWLCSAQNRTEGRAQAGEVVLDSGHRRETFALSVAVTRVAPTACPRQLVGDSALGQQHRCASD